MLARSFRSRSVAALATCAMAACAYTASPLESVAPYRVPSLTPTSWVIDAERIRRSGAITAWDAVRMLVPRYRLEAARIPSLRMLGAPGARAPEASIRFIMDGHEIMELDALRAIPAREIIAIHVLNASEAAMYFPASGGGGAIAMQTRMSLRSR